MSPRLTFLFSGGGTGGHLFPGVAVARALLQRMPQSRIVFVGSERGLEAEIVGREGFEHRPLSVVPSTELRRHPLRFAFAYGRGLRGARRLLAELQPAAVIGLGGFASVPVVLAASRAGIPCVLLEQNVVAGRATRWLSRRAALVCLSFAETAAVPRRTPTCMTGNPVRPEIAALTAGDRTAGGGRPELLVLGGSQGASAVNRAVVEAVAMLGEVLRDWRIVHQTGRADEEDVKRRYVELGIEASVGPFFDDLPLHYARAALAVSRAGATTLAELACGGVPALLIPYPNSVGDHQRLNALAYESAGGAITVEQESHSDWVERKLAPQLRALMDDAERRDRMRAAMRDMARPAAAARVADQVLAHCGINPAPPGLPRRKND